jgi:cell division protein FtsA
MEVIIDKVQQRAFDQAQSQLNWETGNKDMDVRLVNSAIVSIHSDGIKISNPIGFTGKDIAIQLYTAFAPQIHIGALEKIASDLDLELLAVAAEPFAMSRSVIGTDASTNFSAILIDVGGGTTDIAVVDDGGVEGTKMFGIGGRGFTKNIANELDISFDEAEKFKMKLDSGELDEEQLVKAKKGLQKIVDVWLSGVELALGEFDQVDHLPHKILLCGGGSSLQALFDALEETDWYKDLPFTRKPSIQHISPKQVDKIVDSTGKIKDHTFITAMGLLRVGYDTTFDDEQDESVVNKLNKMLKI